MYMWRDVTWNILQDFELILIVILQRMFLLLVVVWHPSLADIQKQLPMPLQYKIGLMEVRLSIMSLNKVKTKQKIENTISALTA